MTRAVKLDIAASGAAFVRIPLLPTSFPLSGLSAYWSPDVAVDDGTGRVANIAPWRGTQKLVASSGPTSPLIETAGGKKVFHTTIARVDRLITEPAPAGGAVLGDFTAGMTIVFAAKVLDITQVNGLASLFGFRFRTTAGTSTTTKIQLQKGGTSEGTKNIDVLADVSVMSVLALSIDRVAQTAKLYVNGVLKTTGAGVGWTEFGANTLFIYGNNFNGSGQPSEGQFGDVAVYTRALSDAEHLTVAAVLKTKYGIA